jgi:Nucleoplasmin-like domain
MSNTAEIPDVRFWGMIVKAGDRGVYQIDNEQGLMEMCHLTNVALVSDATNSKPVYVKVRSPEDEKDYVIGALIPGQFYSFATDLVISPDTQFMHTGGKGSEVHLTGYRCGFALRALLRAADILNLKAYMSLELS